MHDGDPTPAPLTRSELEFELGRLALAVMRSAPDAFDLPAPGSLPPLTAEDFDAAARALLARTRAEHRGFVLDRLRQLADSSVGLHLEGFERDAFLFSRQDPRTGGSGPRARGR